ncbi:MAG: bifunctional metallophosphatase/5'-nucleotidase [Planctomycetes bacterium]|nr:bifunctional metallophosphatase/5'-nucleotidase [Planctomycetota bacterium]
MLLRRVLSTLLLLALAASAEVRVVTVLHTNDLHGALVPNRDFDASGQRLPEFGGAARIAAILALERASAEKEGRAVLLLDAGDFFHGTPEGNSTKGRAVVEFMNAVRYDAMTLGNHDWAYGEENLRDLRKLAKFPFLTCNVTVIDPASPAPAKIVEYAVPWTRLDAGGVRVTVIGLTTPGTPDMNLPEHCPRERLDFLPYERQGADYLRRARGDTDLVIALSHLGSSSDEALARKAPGWDLIVGGHDHRSFERGIEKHGTLMVQAGCSGEFVGRVDISWDTAARKIVKREARLIRVDASIVPDPAVAALLVPRIEAGMDQAFGTTGGFLGRSPPESPLGCLLADAIRMAADADVALLNTGGVRADLPAGPVTRRDLYMAAPFEDSLLTVSLTGAELRQLLDGAFREGRLSYPVSGMSFTVNASKPAGERILGLKVGGAAFDPSKSYSLATTRFAAARLEGDQVARKVMAPEGKPRARKEVPGTLQEALLKLFEGGAIVAPPEKGRVQFIGKGR